VKSSRSTWIHISVAIIIALAALLFVRLHNAGGVTSSLDNELPSLSRAA
jgi:cytochrome c